MLSTLGAVLAYPLRLLFETLRLPVLLLMPRRPPAYVQLRLKGGLVWRRPPARGLSLFRHKEPMVSVEGFRRALADAGRSPGVRGVILQLEQLRGSAARIDGLRQVIEAFRLETGKEVVAYVKSADTSEYPLLASASRIVLAPGGPVHLMGHAATVSAYRGLLDRIGVVPEFFRKGRYKVAPEQYTLHEPSPETRAYVEEVLDRRHERLVAAIAGRLGSADTARRAIDEGPYTSRGAREARLVDDLAYPDELPARLAAAGEKEARVGSLADLRRSRRWRVEAPRLRARPRIELVPVSGLIKPGRSFRWPGGPRMAGEATVVAALDVARKNRAVRAVVVSVDSRGGAAPASELIWRAVLRCAEEKPTVAWIDAVAASGGYFAAAGARRIVAGSQALVGSIGVFAGRFDARRLFDRLGIHREVFLRGAHAGLLSPEHELTDGEREVLQREVDEIYEEFVDRVARGRRRTPEEVRAVAEGRVYVASSAPELLVDEVGLFPAAVAWAAREIGADPEDVAIHEVARPGLKPDLRELLAVAGSFTVAQPWLLWPEVVEIR